MIVTQGPIEAALAYADRVGNRMAWCSTADSSLGADIDEPPGGGFAMNVFLRDGETVYRTSYVRPRRRTTHAHVRSGRCVALRRQEEWQDSPEGWPKGPTFGPWLDSPDVARLYGPST